MTSTHTTSTTFTRTDAQYLASKVGADLYQCHRRYGHPAAGELADYVAELEEQLAGGWVSRYEFGFVGRGNSRILSWSYTVTAAGLSGGDDRPGGIYLTANLAAATWFNSLTPTPPWWQLSDAQRQEVNRRLPFVRQVADGPVDGDGRWVRDRIYGAGGVLLPRSTFRPN